jgi:hypothetical protein
MDDLQELRRLEVEPGETLVARFKSRLSEERVARIRDVFAKVLPGVRVLVLDDDADLLVVRTADVAKAPAGETA